ncbi:MAG: radical SAM protein, partial [Arenicellales bacterium]|nr:radical SAM protein [Arenicellales bacterium]
MKGRGALSNEEGRFESIAHVAIDDGWGSQEVQDGANKTAVSVDISKTVISRNQSPDVPFEQSVNPYRGCEHGCVYCYARPSHSYLGLSPGLDFERKLFYKPDVVEQLQQELSVPGYRCQVLALGTNTDPYQPIEKRYRLMRGILELMLETEHPITITTKSSLVERDIDLLQELAARDLVMVSLSVTTLDHDVARKLEPRATAPRRRVQSVSHLSSAGVPVH